MSPLYISFVFMLAIAIAFLVIAVPRKITAYLASLFIVFALALYLLFGNAPGLSAWLARGQAHYHLLIEVDRLGGMETIVKRIATHLTEQPNDAKGWMILGKIWLAERQYLKAQAAFTRVLQLEPNNNDAKKLLQAAQKP